MKSTKMINYNVLISQSTATEDEIDLFKESGHNLGCDAGIIDISPTI